MSWERCREASRSFGEVKRQKSARGQFPPARWGLTPKDWQRREVSPFRGADRAGVHMARIIKKVIDNVFKLAYSVAIFPEGCPQEANAVGGER